jgi:hypothetical protein
MTFLEHLFHSFHSLHPTFYVAIVPAFVILLHLIPWLVDPHGLRSFPGPWIARFSDLWLGRVAQQGHRSEVVHQLHEKYGERPSKLDKYPLFVIRRNRPNPSLTTLTSPRDVRPHRPKPPLRLRSRSAAGRLCTRQWLAQVQLLRRVRFHHTRPLQHPGPHRAHAQAQDHLAHLFSEKRLGIRALRQGLRGIAHRAMGQALRWWRQGLAGL